MPVELRLPMAGAWLLQGDTKPTKQDMEGSLGEMGSWASQLPQLHPCAGIPQDMAPVPSPKGIHVSVEGMQAPVQGVLSTAYSQAALWKSLPVPLGWDQPGLLQNHCLWGLENNPELEFVTCVKHLGS